MSDKKKKPAVRDYTADDIQALDGRSHVRLRSAMYIGDRGAGHLLVEVIDNTIDEAVAGACSEVSVSVEADGESVVVFEVSDNGRGIPVAQNKKEKRPTCLLVFDRLQTGGKFAAGGAFGAGVGLHGVGAKATNFLSTFFEFWTHRDGKVYYARYEDGLPVLDPKGLPKKAKRVQNGEPLFCLGKSDGAGTRVRFSPDPQFFEEEELVEYDIDWLKVLLREASYVVPQAAFTLSHNGVDLGTFKSEDGLRERLDDKLAEYAKVHTLPQMQHEPIRVDFLHEGDDPNDMHKVELVAAWTNAVDAQQVTYVNTKHMVNGGSHETGVKLAVTRVIQKLAKEADLKGLATDDFRAGLFYVMHYGTAVPKFVGQTKDKLANKDASGNVSRAITAAFEKLFEDNPDLLSWIIERAKALKDQRRKMRSARDTFAKIEAQGRRAMPLPDKAALSPRCKPEDRELFLVEGASAGGTAKMARDSEYQEVLPLRGKVINSESTDPLRVLQNAEIQAMAALIGAGLDQTSVGDGCDPSKSRVGKVVLLMDADSDGLHIASLVLAFLWTFMRPVIRAGMVYVVDSPLWRATKGKKRVYGATLAEVQAALPGAERYTRFKGHGEAQAAELQEYAMHLATRKLIRVTEEGLADAKLLMGNAGDEKRELLGVPKQEFVLPEVVIGDHVTETRRRAMYEAMLAYFKGV